MEQQSFIKKAQLITYNALIYLQLYTTLSVFLSGHCTFHNPLITCDHISESTAFRPSGMNTNHLKDVMRYSALARSQWLHQIMD